MRKPYVKQGPPAWQRKVLLVVAFLFGATVLLFAAWAIILFLDTAGS